MPAIEALANLTTRERVPGFRGQFIHSDSMTFADWDSDPAAVLPQDSHLDEQVVNVLAGEFGLSIHECSVHL